MYIMIYNEMNQLIQMSRPYTTRGRPKGSGVLKHPNKKSTVPARLSPECIQAVVWQKRFGESLSDTILRLARTSDAARKKVDGLEDRLSTLQERGTVIMRGGA